MNLLRHLLLVSFVTSLLSQTNDARLAECRKLLKVALLTQREREFSGSCPVKANEVTSDYIKSRILAKANWSVRIWRPHSLPKLAGCAKRGSKADWKMRRQRPCASKLEMRPLAAAVQADLSPKILLRVRHRAVLLLGYTWCMHIHIDRCNRLHRRRASRQRMDLAIACAAGPPAITRSAKIPAGCR